MVWTPLLTLLLALTLGGSEGLGAQAPPASRPIASGEIRSLSDHELESPTAYLKSVDASGTILWEAALPVEDGGRFQITADRLAALPDSGHAFVTAEARWHLEGRAELTLRRERDAGDGAGWVLTPDRFLLVLEPTRPDLTVLFLIPALVGSLLPVLFWRAASGAAPPGHPSPPGEPSPRLRRLYAVTGAVRTVLHTVWRHLPGLYALLATVIWAAVVARMLLVYLDSGVHWMPLFWPDLVISTGAPIFAFVGSLVYVAFSLYRRSAEGIGDAPDKLFRTLGGRILSAPYVAVVGYVTLSTVFPTLHGGPEAIFFSFFAGLWVKAILDFLNRTGKQLLSDRALARLEERLTRERADDVPTPPTTRSTRLRPRLALDRARRELRASEGVVGVTLAAGPEGEEVVALLDPGIDAARRQALGLPDSLDGVVVRARALPPAGADCDPVAGDLFWERAAARDAASPGPDTSWVGEVLLARVGTLSSLGAWGGRFAAYRAYREIAEVAGDCWDFVQFVVDADWWQAAYYPVDPGEVRGIGYRRRWGEQLAPGGVSWRSKLGSERLLGLQVHSRDRFFVADADSGEPRPDLRSLLHELGHQWLCYVDAAVEGRPVLLLNNGEEGESLMHWDHWVDDGASCMNYRRRRWVIEEELSPDGATTGRATFKQKPLDADRVGAYRFCGLEMHLMGFLPGADVGAMRVLEPATATGGGGGTPTWSRGRYEYTGSVREVSFSAVTALNGRRSPDGARTERTYRQLFVVLAEDADRGRELAERVDQARPLHEENVRQATDGLLNLGTARP